VKGILKDLKYTTEIVEFKGRTVLCYILEDCGDVDLSVVENLKLDYELYPNYVVIDESVEHVFLRRRDGLYIFIRDDELYFVNTHIRHLFKHALMEDFLTVDRFLNIMQTTVKAFESDEELKWYRYTVMELLAMLIALDLVIIYDGRGEKCLKMST